MATSPARTALFQDAVLDRDHDSDVVVAILPLPSPQRTLGALALAAVALCGLSLLDVALGQRSSLLRLFSTGAEANFPTWLSSAMWLAAAGCAGAIGSSSRRLGEASGRRWLLLAACFLLLAIDETAQAHEQAVGSAMDMIERATGLTHAPARLAAAACAGVALLALAAWMWPLMRTLPQALHGRLLLAGAVFVGGALGLEILSRMVSTRYLSPFEELGEMLGVALLLTALLPCVRGVITRLPSAGAPPA